ncbi:SCO0930 family lipoprotein [Actinophytocola sp.]|uniref:SCO0930 family lipoprotein n=1 Tax=Actinophytocola sp. TaxID=1872138 RepID=UPI002ED4EF45
MPRKHLVLPVFAGLALLTGCGAAAGPPTNIQPAAQQKPAQAVSVNAASVAGLGTVLTDQGGKTLYMFNADGTNPPESRCVKECAEMWPPLLATSAVKAQGIDPAVLGTVERPDGLTQVTVSGSPVYTYSGDTKPGEANGQGLQNAWYALSADGQQIAPPGQKTEAPEEKPEESPDQQTESPAQVSVVATNIPGFGKALTDQDGRTLYLFTNDKTKPPASKCVDDCAEKWPPLLTTDEDIELDGVDPKLVGTVTRPDGTKQVTVGNWPVYTYVEDKKPGQTNGHGVGGVWFVIEEEGCKSTAPVKAAKSSKSSVKTSEEAGEEGY